MTDHLGITTRRDRLAAHFARRAAGPVECAVAFLLAESRLRIFQMLILVLEAFGLNTQRRLVINLSAIIGSASHANGGWTVAGRLVLRTSRLTWLEQVDRVTMLQCTLLLVLCAHFTTAHTHVNLSMRLLTCLRLTRRRDDEVDLRALRTQRGGLLVKNFLDLLVLDLVEHSLQQPFQLILAHDILTHLNEGNLGCLPHVLAGIRQISR